MVDKAAREPSAPQRAMHKLGLVRDIDLALHLPARYEDETRLDRLAEARDGLRAKTFLEQNGAKKIK